MGGVKGRLRPLWRSRRAEAPIKTLVLFLFLFMVLSVVMEFMRGMVVLNDVRDSLDRAVISVATNNSYNSYRGFREGDAATPDFESWRDLDDVVEHLKRELGNDNVDSGYVVDTARSGNKWTLERRMSDGTTECVITVDSVGLNHENYDGGSDSTRYVTQAKVELHLLFFQIPVKVNVDVNVETYYMPVFV